MIPWDSSVAFGLCADHLRLHSGPMARARNEEPGSRTAAFRNLLQREDLTMKMVRRRTNFALVAAIAALALVGWLLAHFG